MHWCHNPYLLVFLFNVKSASSFKKLECSELLCSYDFSTWESRSQMSFILGWISSPHLVHFFLFTWWVSPEMTFSPSSIWGQKNTYTIILPRSSQQFSERHYIGLRLVVSDMSMRFHDHLRQPCPPRVFFLEREKKGIYATLSQNSSWMVFLMYKGP